MGFSISAVSGSGHNPLHFSAKQHASVFPELRKSPAKDGFQSAKKADVLVILAHPDDEVLMAGTLATLSKEGHSIQMVYVTSGNKGKNLISDDSGLSLSGLRENEVREALKMLGINRPPIFLVYGDGTLNPNQTDLKEDITTLAEGYQPKVILTFGPDGVTQHEDHKALSCLVRQAVKDTTNKPAIYQIGMPAAIPRLLKSFLKRLPGWEKMTFTPRQTGTIDVNLKKTHTRKQKLAAIDAHASQFGRGFKRVLRLIMKTTPLETFTRSD